jgi:hypothetical protein
MRWNGGPLVAKRGEDMPSLASALRDNDSDLAELFDELPAFHELSFGQICPIVKSWNAASFDDSVYHCYGSFTGL